MTYIRVLGENAKYTVKQFPVGTKVRFMQDGAGIHRGLVVQNYWRIVKERGLCGREVELIDWPPYSLDLNPIEHVWVRVKSELDKRYYVLLDLKCSWWALRKRIEEAGIHQWELLPGHYSNTLARMPARIHAVLEEDGWYTKF